MTHPVQHLALILDGNRRWARAQGMNKIQGHQYGLDNIHTILEHCGHRDISTVSLYAFSTENWNRSPEEVQALMSLFDRLLLGERDRLLEHRVQIRFVGELQRFSAAMQEAMREIEQQTADRGPRQLFICLSYGGRLELVRAAEALAQSGEAYTEENFQKYLWTHDMSDVDLVIRTGGNQRLSNFLLWRAAYAELYFTPTLWPDFSTQELDDILAWYQRTIEVNKGI